MFNFKNITISTTQKGAEHEYWKKFGVFQQYVQTRLEKLNISDQTKFAHAVLGMVKSEAARHIDGSITNYNIGAGHLPQITSDQWQEIKQSIAESMSQYRTWKGPQFKKTVAGVVQAFTWDKKACDKVDQKIKTPFSKIFLISEDKDTQSNLFSEVDKLQNDLVEKFGPYEPRVAHAPEAVPTPVTDPLSNSAFTQQEIAAALENFEKNHHESIGFNNNITIVNNAIFYQDKTSCTKTIQSLLNNANLMQQKGHETISGLYASFNAVKLDDSGYAEINPPVDLKVVADVINYTP